MNVINTSKVESKDFLHISQSLDNFSAVMSNYFDFNSTSIFIVTDENIMNLYEKDVCMLKSQLSAELLCIKPGEENKSFETIYSIYDFLIENNANRDSVIVALGGGVVGDLVGFAASTFMRGIRYINIPTTLISQVDSCIGGKTGYNFKELKNIIGTFYSPTFVYVNISFLHTLSQEHFISGLGEVIKYGLILDKELFEYIENKVEDIKDRNAECLTYLVKKCLSLKDLVIREDFNDSGKRNILNFGHTIGHAIEFNSMYKIFHGNAVALGMLTAIKLSEVKYGCPKELYCKVENLYTKFEIPSKYKVDNHKLFLYAINRDKKNDKSIRFVLIKDIAKPVIKISVDECEVLDAISKSID